MRRAKGGGKNSEHDTYRGFCALLWDSTDKKPHRYVAFTWRGKPMRQQKNLDGYAVFCKTVSFWQRPYAGNSREDMRLGRHGGAKTPQEIRRRRKKTQPCAALKTRASQGCNKKTFRRALSFDLTGEIAYNLCITTCGVCRKNKGVTVC